MSAAASNPGLNLTAVMAMSAPERVNALQGQPNAAAALRSLGDQAETLASRDVAAALVAGAVLESLAAAHGDADSLARIRRAYAAALAHAGKFAESLALAQRARADALAGKAGLEGARALVTQMHPLMAQGKAADAIRAGESARAEFLAAGEPALAARVDINLANVHKAIGDATRALGHLDAALPVLGSGELRPIIDNARGESLFLLDRFAEARQAFEAARQVLGPAGGMAAAVVAGNLADLAARQGNYQEALDAFATARAALGTTASAHAARMAVEEAEVYESLGVGEMALQRLVEGIIQFEQLGMEQDAVRALIAKGRAMSRQADASAAAATFDSAATKADALGQRSLALHARLLQASTLARLGKLAPAKAIIAAVDRSAAAGPIDRTCIHYHASVVHERSGTMPAALQEIDAALTQATTSGVEPVQADVLTQRALVLRRSGRGADAAADARRAVGIVERLRGSVSAERTREGLLAHRLGAYEELVLALVDDGSASALSEAMTVAEQAKSRLLIDRMRQGVDSASQGAAAPQAQRLSELRGRLDALYAKLADGARNDVRFVASSTVRKQIEAIEREMEVVELAVGHATPEAVPVVLRADWSIPQSMTMVEYFRARDRWLAFVVANGRTTVVRLAVDDEALQSMVGRLHFHMHQALLSHGHAPERHLGRAEQSFARLGEAIWQPLVPFIGDHQRVTVVPHGALHSIPFCALRVGGEALIDRHEIVHAPSATVAAALSARPRTAPASGEMLIVGVPDLAAPLIGDEVDQLSRLMTSATVLRDEAATRSAVSAALAKADSAHLALHGLFLPEAPGASGLRLSDGWLTARDIRRIPRLPQMIVLSGCETGATVVRDGDEHFGLVSALMSGGATDIIASLWPVHDRSTAAMMAQLHRRRAQPGSRHESPATALRAAALEARQISPHPAHWAAFVAFGGGF